MTTPAECPFEPIEHPGVLGEEFSASGRVSITRASIYVEFADYERLVVSDVGTSGEYVHIASEGACELYAWTRGAECDPPCPSGYQCTSADCCAAPDGLWISAGEVTISGLLGTGTVVGTDDDLTYYHIPGLTGPLFSEATVIEVSAEGAEVPAFSATLHGVSELTTAHPNHVHDIELINGVDNVLTWDPADEGARLEVVLLTGHHLGPPTAVLYCLGDDTQGSVTIPQTLVEQFPVAWGPMLFPHPSYIRRVRRERVDSRYGRVEVSASSSWAFTVLHQEPD